MIAERQPFTEEQKAHVSLGMLAWWRDRRPSPRPIEKGDVVALTGVTTRHLRVLEIDGRKVRCEWIHAGKRHTDWFCVSGLRIVTEAT